MKKAIIPILYTFLFSFGNIFADNNLQLDNKNINDIISRLTLEQKARLLVGSQGCDTGISHIVPGAAGYTYSIDSLGIFSINLADGRLE